VTPAAIARPVRVGLYGFFGAGNIGNEASLAAVLARLRTRCPEVEVLCIGADPAQVEREHGIHGLRLMAYRPEPGDSRPLTQLRKVLGRVRDLPRTAALVGRVDVLVVPGTGVLESRLMSRAWGLPYWMATAFTLSRLAGRPAALVCVGADTANRRATRVLLAQTVRSASHVSYRDIPSREAAALMGSVGRPGTVAPDLAFDLPSPLEVAVRPGHVVVGVMTFPGGADDPQRGQDVIARYEHRMSDVVTTLLHSGHTVTFVVGDLADLALAERLEKVVRTVRPETSAGELATNRAADFNDLMTEMASAEVVVASRFHNVIAALKVRRPVISLSYARKNGDLLEPFGLASFDQPVDAFDVDRVVADVDALARSSHEVSDRIASVLGGVEEAVASHLEDVWTSLLTPRVVARARRRRRWPRRPAGSPGPPRPAPQGAPPPAA
jgi:polysaccharide pyruvyl transferase WcaK-like protein